MAKVTAAQLKVMLGLAEVGRGWNKWNNPTFRKLDMLGFIVFDYADAFMNSAHCYLTTDGIQYLIDAGELVETPVQPAPKFSVGDKVHTPDDCGMVANVHADDIICYGVNVGGREDGYFERELTPCDCQPTDPATCDVCGEHQPHVATDSDNDVDVCDECADMAEANNRPQSTFADFARAFKEFCWDCSGTGAFIDVDGYTKTCPECEGLGLLVESETFDPPTGDNQPYTRPAQAIAVDMLPAFTMVSGELKTFAIPARMTHVSSRLLLTAGDSFSDEEFPFANEPQYAVWQEAKHSQFACAVFVEVGRGDFVTYADDAENLSEIFYPNAKPAIKLTYTRNPVGRRVVSYMQAVEALRSNTKLVIEIRRNGERVEYPRIHSKPAPKPIEFRAWSNPYGLASA